jgi:phytoene dehydrogenase-like protein
MRSFQLDPSSVKVDWAQSGAIPRITPPAHAPRTFHVADPRPDVASARTGDRADNSGPALRARRPDDHHRPHPLPRRQRGAVAYTHVSQPDRAVRDADNGSVKGTWDTDCERFADQMQARIERLAPGFGSTSLAQRVLGPHEMEARAHLVGGAVNGGTAQIHQAAGLPSRAAPVRPGRDRGRWALPRVHPGASRRRRARRALQQRLPGRTRP